METPDLRSLVGALVREHFGSCCRCRQPLPSGQAGVIGWVVHTFAMYPIGIICPDCQSPEDRAEAAIRQATSTYSLEGLRFTQHPKPDDDQGHPQSA